MRTGQEYTTVDSEQPKNCNNKDQHMAKQKTREANTSRSAPKKRYSHNHFARANYFVLVRLFIFHTVDDDVMVGVPQVNEASVCRVHIHMPVKEHWKSKHKPHWDVEEERDFEAANLGLGVSEALRAGRPEDWTDTSEGKVRKLGADGTLLQESHRVAILEDAAQGQDQKMEVQDLVVNCGEHDSLYGQDTAKGSMGKVIDDTQKQVDEDIRRVGLGLASSPPHLGSPRM